MIVDFDFLELVLNPLAQELAVSQKELYDLSSDARGLSTVHGVPFACIGPRGSDPVTESPRMSSKGAFSTFFH